MGGSVGKVPNKVFHVVDIDDIDDKDNSFDLGDSVGEASNVNISS